MNAGTRSFSACPQTANNVSNSRPISAETQVMLHSRRKSASSRQACKLGPDIAYSRLSAKDCPPNTCNKCRKWAGCGKIVPKYITYPLRQINSVGKFSMSRSPTISASSSISSQRKNISGNSSLTAAKARRYSRQVPHHSAHRQITRNSASIGTKASAAAGVPILPPCLPAVTHGPAQILLLFFHRSLRRHHPAPTLSPTTDFALSPIRPASKRIYRRIDRPLGTNQRIAFSRSRRAFSSRYGSFQTLDAALFQTYAMQLPRHSHLTHYYPEALSPSPHRACKRREQIGPKAPWPFNGQGA